MSQIWNGQPLDGGCTGLWESQAPQDDCEDPNLALVATPRDLPAPERLYWLVALLLNAAVKLCHAVWPLQHEVDSVRRQSSGGMVVVICKTLLY